MRDRRTVGRWVGVAAVVAVVHTFLPGAAASGGTPVAMGGRAEAPSEPGDDGATTSGPTDPLEIELEVVELFTPKDAPYQEFKVTMTSPSDELCEELDEFPWWTGANCWQPTGWGGNQQVFRHPDDPNKKALLSVGYDCYKEFNNKIESTTCTYWVGHPSFGMAAGPNPLYFIGQAQHNGTGKPFLGRGGASVLVPIDWQKLYQPPNQPPVPNFTWAPASSPANTVRFTNASVDPEGDPLTYGWTFGDTTSSEASDPTHTFPNPGTYQVALTAIDSKNNRATVTKSVTVGSVVPTVVNSTGDTGAEDAASGSCDTGGTVGSDPECTLRAAIQVANAKNGAPITFDIDSSGAPKITLGSPLPAIAKSTTIDGTTQAGGWVEVAGGGERTIQLSGGTSAVRGLAVHGGELAIHVSGGSGHLVEGNRFGTDGAGSATADTDLAVLVGNAPNTVVAENVSATPISLSTELAATTGLTVRDNWFGVDDDGTTPLGTPDAGIFIGAPAATITGNVIRADTAGIVVGGTKASGTTISDNHVGMTEGGAAFDDQGYAIRIEGTPNVTVRDNHLASTRRSTVVVSGSIQLYEEEDKIFFVDPTSDPLDGASTATKVKVLDNTIGVAGGEAHTGVVSWAGATETEVRGNTIVGVEEVGVEVRTGQDHKVGGNTIGSDTAGPDTGVLVDEATGTQVGGLGDLANAIVAAEDGVDITEGSDDADVLYNQIGAVAGGDDIDGIDVTGDGASIEGNLVTGTARGIAVGAGNARVVGNTVRDTVEVGIAVVGDTPTLTGNVVVGSDGDGMAVGGAGATVVQNRIGVEDGSDVVVGNANTGLLVVSGDAEVRRNVIAGSGGNGVVVNAATTAELRANRIWDSGAKPIVAATAPTAPSIDAAIRTGSGADVRTVLLVKELPTGDAGRIELFANSSCSDGEAEFLLEVERTKEVDAVNRIIVFKGNASRDHFTATYTNADGITSALSDCRSIEDHPDTDGDGSVDPIEELGGLEDDPTKGIVITDDEEPLLIGVLPFDPDTGIGGGQLEQLAVGSDPAPESHPAGWSLPYGALSFRITGLDPGAMTGVFVTTLDGAAPPPGTSYWKYGPPTPGAASSWYRFDDDGTSETGASRQDLDIGSRIASVWLLVLGDGLRGDSDGAANGSITDPGGPVIGGDQPPPTTTSTSTTMPTTTTAPVPTVTPTTAPTGPAAGGGTLARTGSDVARLALVATMLLGTGTLALIGRRRRLVT